jgi:Type II secretion system (T2SS), protein M
MSSRDRSLIAIVAVLVVAVGGWLIFVHPVKSQANHLQAQITSENTQLVQAETAVRTGEASEAEYKNFARQLHAVSTAVPGATQVPRLIDQLQSAADRSHTGFETVSLGASVTPAVSTGTSSKGTVAAGSAATAAALPSQGITLSFTGGYFAVAKLLGMLAGFVHADNNNFSATGRLLTIDTVAFGAGPHGYPGVTASVSASDYSVPAGLSASTTSTGTTTATAAADITAP